MESKLTFRKKTEVKNALIPKVADAVRDILETQEHENATLSQTQFKLLDELMKEVNRLIGVHCSETADMTKRIWDAQSKIFHSSGSDLQHLTQTNRRLLKKSTRLEYELNTYKSHASATISSLEDRVKLLESSVCEYKVENEVLKRKLSCSEEEREELHEAIQDNCKGAEIEAMTEKLSGLLDKMELESRKQTEYMLELEDVS